MQMYTLFCNIMASVIQGKNNKMSTFSFLILIFIFEEEKHTLVNIRV